VWLGQGAWIPLTVLPGTYGLGPADINSSRQMAGITKFIANPVNPIAAHYDFATHTMIVLGTLPGGNRSEATGISDDGVEPIPKPPRGHRI
jgi:hypothetical protein